jgi:hypothetical protein
MMITTDTDENKYHGFEQAHKSGGVIQVNGLPTHTS